MTIEIPRSRLLYDHCLPLLFWLLTVSCHYSPENFDNIWHYSLLDKIFWIYAIRSLYSYPGLLEYSYQFHFSLHCTDLDLSYITNPSDESLIIIHLSIQRIITWNPCSTSPIPTVLTSQLGVKISLNCVRLKEFYIQYVFFYMNNLDFFRTIDIKRNYCDNKKKKIRWALGDQMHYMHLWKCHNEILHI